MLHREYIFWRNVADRASASETMLSAAGCGFFATLALFPALGALIPLYGLVFDATTIEPQLESLRALLPPDAFVLISDYIKSTVAQSETSLTFGVIFGFLASLWASAAGSKAVVTAINLVYGYKETRSFIHFQTLGILTTIIGIVGGILAIALMVAAPGLARHIPDYMHNSYVNIPVHLKLLIVSSTPFVVHWVAPGIMLLFVYVATVFIYRFAPCWTEVHWRWILPGALASTLVWVAVSVVFSWYMSNSSMAGNLYGPLGTVAAVMLWFFVSAYVVLFGAVINVQIRERIRESRISGPSLTVKVQERRRR